MKKYGIAQAVKIFMGRKSRRICFFFLRGGLGNQLFQIMSLSNRSMTEDFDIVFCDFDVRQNPRDRKGALGLKMIFTENDSQSEIMQCSRLVEYFLRILRSSRISYFRIPIINIDHSEILPVDNHFIANGYLQENLEFLNSNHFKRPLNLGNFAHFPKPPAKVAIHIRATDSLAKSEMALTEKYYESALEILPTSGNSDIDVYSDDTHFAKNLCAGIRGYNFYYVEEFVVLNSLELLANISSYEYIVCSKSTLAWWAAVFGEKSVVNSMVVSPWDNHFHQFNWTRVSDY